MKLLYATSITLPSRHANRRQIVSMAKALHTLLGENFLLGMSANRGDVETGVPTVLMGENIRSIYLAWKYAWLVRAQSITHIYTREDRLFFFLKLYTIILRLPVHVFFEIHTFRHNFFLSYAVSHADRVIALTRGLQEDISHLRARASVLIAPDGVDIERFATGILKGEARQQFSIPQEATVAAYVGRYDTLTQADKGVKGFIRALGRARASKSLHLLIVGLAAVEVPMVERLCEECSIPKEARTLVPYVPQEEVVLAMHTADMLIMNYPNLPHFARYMSPMKLFEYMAARSPIITSDLPSIREILTDDEAFFVPPGDIDAFADMLIFVADHREEGNHKAAAAFEKVKNRTWDNRAKAILDFITNL